jgi:hypothetical protein
MRNERRAIPTMGQYLSPRACRSVENDQGCQIVRYRVMAKTFIRNSLVP